MAVVLKEVQELEKLKEDTKNQALIIQNNLEYTQEEKKKAIDVLLDQIYEIDQEIIRLKKINPTIVYQESNNSMIFLAIGIAVVFFIANRKK
jgi:hypothetical protein